MANLSWIWLFLISVPQLVRSDGSRRERWEKPDGKNAENFKETYYLGDTIKIEWKGWNTTESTRFIDKNTNEPMAKLYVNAWNPDYSTWFENLAINRKLNSADSFEWNVSVPPDDLRKTKQYAFTFIPNEQEEFSVFGTHISSPGFEIKSKLSTASFTSSDPSSTSTAPSSTTSTASAKTETSSAESSDTSPSTSGLSTGAKAGIGAGASIGGLAVLVALAFLFFRRRNRVPPQDIGATEAVGSGSQQEFKSVIHELSVNPVELAGTPRME